MFYTVISLLIISLILFCLSFFMKDRFKDIEEQIEQISLSTIQETYQIKKKIKILEEEIMPEDLSMDFFKTEQKVNTQEKSNYQSGTNTPMLNQIQKLRNQGYSSEEIALETSLSEHDVRSLMKQFSIDD